jgi:hypothetical protein
LRENLIACPNLIFKMRSSLEDLRSSCLRAPLIKLDLVVMFEPVFQIGACKLNSFAPETNLHEFAGGASFYCGDLEIRLIISCFVIHHRCLFENEGEHSRTITLTLVFEASRIVLKARNFRWILLVWRYVTARSDN